MDALLAASLFLKQAMICLQKNELLCLAFQGRLHQPVQRTNFEEQFADFQAKGIDAIYCVSVNDGFVMNEWARALNIKNVQVIPDGAGAFTEGMGMTVDMSAIGFGRRSRRYAAVVNNGQVEHMFVEPESSATDPDPYGVSSPENVMKHLSGA